MELKKNLKKKTTDTVVEHGFFDTNNDNMTAQSTNSSHACRCCFNFEFLSLAFGKVI